jgi:lipoate-protein ligase A
VESYEPITFLDRTLPRTEENLALDEALLIEADEGRRGAILRIWEPETPAVILGASRRWRSEIVEEACRREGIPVFRRSSGGGTVLIGPGTLNVTLVLPDWAAPGLTAIDVAQSYVLERSAAALREIEPGVRVLGSGDLVIGDRKFAGSAQRRLRRWFLVHYTLMLEVPLADISRYLALPSKQPDYRRGRSHEDFLMNFPGPRTMVVDALRRAWLPSSSCLPFSEVPHTLIESLLSEKFANPAWIERF